MLLSFPTQPPLRQSVERVEPEEEDNIGSTEKEEEIQEEYADYICCICLDIMNDPVSLPCGLSAYPSLHLADLSRRTFRLSRLFSEVPGDLSFTRFSCLSSLSSGHSSLPST
jgi:hypothetical protein